MQCTSKGNSETPQGIVRDGVVYSADHDPILALSISRKHTINKTTAVNMMKHNDNSLILTVYFTIL